MPRLTVANKTEVLIERTLPPVLPDRSDRELAAVLVQPGALEIARSVIDGLGVRTKRFDLPDRDTAKTADVLSDIWIWMAGIGLGRRDTVVGVGGGAATDLAGFAAATWMRGVESVLVPTTLLAAVDAAIGGKTGINVGGKNLVGAFWQPTRVAIGIDGFATLPAEVYREGLAETVKHGYLADPVLLGMLQNDGADAEPLEMVTRSVAVKARVVAADEREYGVRATLNYGHTIGHALEIAHGLSHGDAVAIGMVAAAAVGRRRTGFDATDEHRETLTGLGLPTSLEALDRGAIRRLVLLDKKRTSGGVRMALLADYQQPLIEAVTAEDIEAGLDAITG